MKAKLAAALLAAAGLFQGAAMADRTGGTVARIEAPFATAEKIIVASVVWNCAGEFCRPAKQVTPSVRACRLLARKVGKVASYGSDTAALTEEELARCNDQARERKA